MEERETSPEVELLTKIHNQLVDLTKMIAEIEMTKTTSELLKNKLRQVLVGSQHLNAEGSSTAAGPKQQKVIAPINEGVQPGSGN
jgi:hypothetical protein